MSDEIRDGEEAPREEPSAKDGPAQDVSTSPDDTADEGEPQSGAESLPRTIWWEDGKVFMIDQSRLPLVGDVLECDNYTGVCWAIKGMAVRGAPALGVAAALAVALWVEYQGRYVDDVSDFYAGLEQVAEEIKSTRPTAVNLQWGVERMRDVANRLEGSPLDVVRESLMQEALSMAQEDEERNRMLGKHGAELLGHGSKVLTHCNAGSLATAFFGTALGVIFTAYDEGKIEHVWVDETRPVLQGARLTSWELMMAGVPCALITDSMAAFLMGAGAVDAVIVGADRIAANGDVANKIGTYGLAILAHEHEIPFYVAAPTSTIDLLVSHGGEIEIEHRPDEEVTGITWSGVYEPSTEDAAKAFDLMTKWGPFEIEMQRSHKMLIDRKGGAFKIDGWSRIAPLNVPVLNPAFDITPARYVTAIITERGVARPDYEMSLGVLSMGSKGMHELNIG